MTQRLLLFAAAPLLLALSACDTANAPAPTPDNAAAESAGNSTATAASPPADTPPAIPGAWELVSSGEGDGLFFGAAKGKAARVHFFCASSGGLLVNIHAFRPIGSEERMTLGSGDTTYALVADPAGDADRGGVSGEGPVPASLHAILTGPAGVAVNYGAQNLGPLPPVPAATADAFVTGCAD